MKKTTTPAIAISTNEPNEEAMSQADLDYLQEHEMNRRDFVMDSLAMGGLAATFGLTGSAASWASIQPPEDEVLRIGYLPITDATVLLVAHAKGFF
jgi:NitT/TauT family transport system substrate-binding protein